MNQLLLAVIYMLPFIYSSHTQPVKDVAEPLIFEWDKDFTEAEKRKMYDWLDGISMAVFDTLGYYPFPIHVYMHKSSGSEPVPWANTVRGEKQGVHFHVNPDYSIHDFFKDWTATHELSHLSIPFVGKENMWFSEGYASFMQWYILQNNGTFTLDEVHEFYQPKLEYAIQQYQSNKSFLKRAEELKKTYDYPALYWGGATFFFQVNEVLKQQHQTNLFAVIKAYQNQNRLTDRNIEDLIHSLDAISNSSVFSDHYNKYAHQKAKDAVLNTPLPR